MAADVVIADKTVWSIVLTLMPAKISKIERSASEIQTSKSALFRVHFHSPNEWKHRIMQTHGLFVWMPAACLCLFRFSKFSHVHVIIADSANWNDNKQKILRVVNQTALWTLCIHWIFQSLSRVSCGLSCGEWPSRRLLSPSDRGVSFRRLRQNNCF